VLVERINDPEASLPTINENIVNYLKPDIEMYTEAEEQVSAFDDAFKLTEGEVQPDKIIITWFDYLK